MAIPEKIKQIEDLIASGEALIRDAEDTAEKCGGYECATIEDAIADIQHGVDALIELALELKEKEE